MGILDKLKLKETQHCKGISDRELTLLHLKILQKKFFLRNLYIDFYRQIQQACQPIQDKVIFELGSGGGFIKEVMPNVITSDILDLPNVDKIFSACSMPMVDCSVDVFVMLNVLHHIPDVCAFFAETTRCLKPNGRVIMIEPANTAWGHFIYTHFHHEDFDCEAQWEFDSDNPLLTANGALAWIVFHRDKKKFESRFPNLKIRQIRHHTPLRYLLSGGFTLKQLIPTWSYSCFKGIEWCLSPLNSFVGMFETIILEKILNEKK